MLTSDVRKLSSGDRLLYWIREREAIRLRKEAGEPWPWTDDEILRTYRFCNVRRMDDRVSRWLLANWYEPYRDHPNMLLACTLARQLNNPESLVEVGFPTRWNPNRVQEVLDERADTGLRNYSSAYMITANYGHRGRERETKPYQTVWRVCDVVYRSGIVLCRDSVENTWRSLLNMPGFSSFIAGQVVADLRWALSGQWRGRNRWAPQGPGSTRGLARLLGLDPSVSMSLAVWRKRFDDVLETVFNQLPWEIRGRLEAMDCQASLCEFDKYERALWGECTPKQLYRRIEK